MGQVKDGLPAEAPAFVSAIWRLIGARGGMQYGLAGSGARNVPFYRVRGPRTVDDTTEASS